MFSVPRIQFSSVVDEYLNRRERSVRHGDLSENTLRSDKGSFKVFMNFLSEEFPDTLYIDQFEGDQGEELLHDYIQFRRRHKISPNTIRRDLRHVSGLFSFLRNKTKSHTTPRISINPFLGLTLPKPTKRKDFPSQSDWESLRDYLRTEVKSGDYDWFKRMILLQIETGCRISEVLTLKWEHGDDDLNVGGGRVFSYLSEKNRRWVIYSKRRERTIPLEEMSLTDLVSTIPRPADSVFIFENPSTKNPYLVSSVSRMFKRLLKEVGVAKTFSTHGNRHGFISYLLNQGFSPYQIGQIVGHSSSQITEIYGHVDLDVLGGMFEKLKRISQNDSQPS